MSHNTILLLIPLTNGLIFHLLLFLFLKILNWRVLPLWILLLNLAQLCLKLF